MKIFSCMFSFIYTKICTKENLPLYGTPCKVTDTIVFIIAEKPKTPDLDLSVENSHLVPSLKVHVHVACLPHSKPMQELGKSGLVHTHEQFCYFYL